MQNPIQQFKLFATPESAHELIEIANAMENRLEATEMMMFTLNYCHSLVEREIELSRDHKKYKLVTG
jgi:hypothetical protein